MNNYKNLLDRHHKYLRYLLVLSFITFVILVAATSAQGISCLSIDAVSTGTTALDTDSSMTVSHTTGSNSDRLMLVAISVNVNDDERVATTNGVTYGGTALTKVGERNNDNDAMVYIYSLVAPNPGPADVVITFDSALNYGALAGVMTFTGVHQSTPLGTFASAIGNDGTPATVDISSAPGELVFAVVADEYDAITTAPTGQDVHWNTCTSGTSNCGAGGTIAGASTVTMTWDLDVEATPSNHWAIGGVSIKPSSTKSVVMVVGDAVTLSTSDQNKKAEFESWGWTVTAIDDDAVQGTYDNAAVNNDVMYISESTASSTVGTKATLLDIGIVNEENYTWDQMRFTSSADQDLTHTTILIDDNSHYITSPFSTGNMMIYPSADCIGNMTAGLASGGQLLATENNTGSATLFYFETGAALTSGTAPNRRVGIPTSCSSFSSWNADAKTIVQRSLDWASGCGAGGGSSCGTNLVMVTLTGDFSSSYDTAKKNLFESWGWTVSAIEDLNGDYSGAASSNDVMFISESSESPDIGTQATNLNIGIVVEEAGLQDEMELGSSQNYTSGTTGTQIDIVDNAHYIASTLGTGALTIYSSTDSLIINDATPAPGAVVLAEEVGGNNTALVAIATGETLDNGAGAVNRRVGFTGMHESNPSNWTSSMETLVQRSLDWAAGCGAAGGGTNNAPVLDPIGNKSVDEGQLLEFTISATDADAGDTLTYSASNLPTGATFTPATQTFSWTPNVGDAGSYPDVLFTVDDDGTPQKSDSEGITITVNSSGGGGLGTPINAGDVADYSCNMKITIDNTKVAFTSENFPVLIHITDDSLKTSGCGFVTDPDGDDIVFTNSNLTLQLNHEIEKYDAATGEIVAWVLVPALSGSSDTDIYMYFGNSNVTTFQGDSTAVWDSNYVGVWHLHDTSGDTQDSTSYNTDGVVSGTVTRGATGKIEDAFNFGTSGEVDWGNPADDHLDAGTGNWTVSLWANIDNNRGSGEWEKIINKGKGSWETGYEMELDDTANNLYFGINDGSTQWGRSTSVSFSLDTWTHFVGVVDRTNNLLRLYKNGVQVDTTDITSYGDINQNNGDTLTIGKSTWGWPDGLIEEVRLSKTARSAEWIQTSHNNQNSPSSFYSYEVQCPSTVPPIAEFSCSIPITIDSSKVIGTDHSDFPVLISLTNTSLRTTGGCGYVQNSNGYDIIFSDSTQTTRLDHEIEKYDGASGELVAWVKVPTLSATVDTVINLHFGHSSVCGATENPTGVWDSNYTAVWHLKETSGGADAIKDSTARANHGTDFNSPTFGVTGKIGNAVDFDGTADYATMPTSGFNTSAGTVELWTNIDTFPSADNKYMFSHFTPSPVANRVYVNLKPDNTWGTGMGDTYDLVRGSVVSAGTWYHLVLTWDGTNVRGYKDGALNFGPTSYSGLTTVGNIYVSAWDDTAEWFDGTLDEVRVSNTTRSAGWIETSYNNQSSPSTFYSVGANSCFLSGFSCNRRITIDSTKVMGTDNLDNFPFLVKIQNDCNIKTAANGGGVQNSNGWDIIFTDSDGVTQLDHEIEEYNGTTGDLTAWVRVPTLPYNSDKDVYMHYGKSGLTCDPSNPTGVWDSSDYQAVYHLNEGTNFQDSTSHNRDATAEDTDGGTGMILDGEAFGPQDEIAIGNWNFSGAELTLQTWARFHDFDQDDPRVFSKANGTSAQNHVFMLGLGGTGENYLRMRVKTGTDDLTGTTTIIDTDEPLTANKWYLIAGTYDGSNMRLLVDGAEVHSAAKTGNLRVNSWNVALGNHPGNTSSTYTSMDGQLDEVRILSVARSAGWLETEYKNQSAPDTFSTMSQDTCGGAYGFNYQYCKKITVDYTQVNSDLTDFPLLINIANDDDLKTVANGGRVQHSQGWDIVFRTDGCGNLDHEIEKYDGSTGDLVAWVETDLSSSAPGTAIYMYYGASNVICSPENPAGVWDDSNYVGVWHLTEEVAGTGTADLYQDSTLNDNDGDDYVSATGQEGQIDGGQQFDGTDDYVDAGNSASLDVNYITIEFWLKVNSWVSDGGILAKGTSSARRYWIWTYGGTVAFEIDEGGNHNGAWNPPSGQWQHLALTYDGSNVITYRNGDQEINTYPQTTGVIDATAEPLLFGDIPPYNHADVYLDEVRISDIARSAAWIKTSYNNQSNPNFITVGSCFEQTTSQTNEWKESFQ